MNMTVDKVLYTGQAHTAGGRNGAFKTRSNDQKARLARAVDLEEVTLVDAEIVRFLGTCEARRATLLNCSPYIRD
jgi:hypothetical protein